MTGQYWFDHEKVNHVVTWIETYCTHPIGDLAGQPLVLPEWFKRDVITPLFGWKRANGTRRYTRVYCEVPRGNAKSTLSTAVSLYCLCADGQKTPRVFCAAGSKDQASLVFDPAKIMVKQHPDLMSELKIYQNSIMLEANGGVMKVVSADGDLQQGLNGTMVSFDELHVQPNSRLYDAFNNMFVKRQEPLMLMLTTAGVLGSFAAEVHDYAVQVRDGVLKDDRFLPVIYAGDLEADDFDEKQWIKANPGWDYLNQAEFRANAEKAKQSAVERVAFRRFHLNKWSGADVTWMPDDVWMKGADEPVTLEKVKGRKCYVGLDLSSNRDTTAAVFVFPPTYEGEAWQVLPRVYIPQLTLFDRADRETVQYLEWADAGDIVVTPGATQDYEYIRKDIETIGQQVQIQCIGFDSWNANETVQQLEKAGLPTMAYQQSFRWMSAPMQKLESLIQAGELNHGGHPVLRWQASNLQAENKGDFIRPTKSSSKGRIDGVVALIVAIGTYLVKLAEKEQEDKSVVKKGMVAIKLRR